MKNLFLLFALATVIMFSCSSPKQEKVVQQDEKPRLDSILRAFNEERLKFFPLEATYAGDDRFNDTLPNDLSDEFRQKLKGSYTNYMAALKTINPQSLKEEDRISYEILEREIGIVLESLTFKDNLMPINQFSSLPIYVGILATGKSVQPFKTAKDYDNWLSRLDDYLIWCDTTLVKMRQGIKEGYVIPKTLVEKTIPQFASFDHGKATEHLFYTPVTNFPDGISAEDKDRLTKAYEKIVSERVIPTYKKISEFLTKEYLPASRTSTGISDIPQGKEYYNYLVKYYTTTDLKADEIFKIGQSEVDRITKEMEKVKQEVGFKGDLKAFFVELRTKKELVPYTKPEEVIANFKNIHERMKPNLEKIFDKTPTTPFEIRRTEAFREKSSAAQYFGGSLDGTRPGIFYVPIPNVKEYNILSDEDLFLHEAIPGHHFQISLQQENKDLPELRKILGYSSFAEGWALYTESLGKELGLYTDPYQYFGMLSSEMHRAIRLVVDAGMHTQGWTREQAIQYSLDHEAETEEGIISEIERYMAIPGQALSYKIGQLKIRELRSKAEKELGDKFRLAEFHNQVLTSGSLPLNILEKKIDRWIEREKKETKA
jgi:uncharacterized protein (DUF885 family)